MFSVKVGGHPYSHGSHGVQGRRHSLPEMAMAWDPSSMQENGPEKADHGIGIAMWMSSAGSSAGRFRE